MADEVVKTHDLENQDLLGSEEKTLCVFCKKQPSKYTCPRCNVRYCSISCYKNEKHLKCSEDFYKQNVLETLRQETGSQQQAEGIIEMLKRLEEEEKEGDGNIEVDDLGQRLKGIDLDKDPKRVWELLTDEERHEFSAAVDSGELADSIEVWTPWWEPDESRTKRIEELSTSNGISKGNTMPSSEPRIPQETKQLEKAQVPEILENIISLDSVLKTSTPNPAIKYNIVDVLYAYAYAMHLYNGTPSDDIEASAETLYSLSSVLSKNMTFESAESVVYNCLNSAIENRDLVSDRRFATSVLEDVVHIINGYKLEKGKREYFVDSAISDIHRLFAQGIKTIKKEKKTDKVFEKKLWLAKKKLEFFLSWCQEHVKVLRSVAPHVKSLYTQEIADFETHESQRRTLEGKWKGPRPPPKKTLIQEL